MGNQTFTRSLKDNATSGFSLIELLVVVGIIGVLASLLLPVLSRTKMTAKDLLCVSNERQISLGLHAVWTDDEDRIWNHRFEEKPRWFRQTLGNESRLWQCPRTESTLQFQKKRGVFVYKGLKSGLLGG